MNAQKRFCLIVAIVLLESLIAFTSLLISPAKSVISAVSMATSVPVPIAIPTSAKASAGASFMPSQHIATTAHSSFSERTTSAF